MFAVDRRNSPFNLRTNENRYISNRLGKTKSHGMF